MRLIVSLLIFSFVQKAEAQSLTGSRAYAMGEAVAALSGGGIILGNPASVKTPEYLSSYSFLPEVAGLNRMAFAAHWRAGAVVLDAGVQRLGDLTASMDRLHAGLASQIGNSSLGIRVNFDQYKAIFQQTDFNCSLSAGLITRLGPTFSFGAWLDNLSLSSNTVTENFRPLKMEAGVCLEVTKMLRTLVSVNYQINQFPILRMGMEYTISKKIDLRLGQSTFPTGIYSGFGFHYWNVYVDVAASWRQHEGPVFQATARYTIPKTR